MLTHPMLTLFRETTFRPLWGVAPSNFLHDLQPPKLYFLSCSNIYLANLRRHSDLSICVLLCELKHVEQRT